MTVLKKPVALPRCFDSLWNLIAREDAAVGSRRKLAAKLRVSTHTLQRLLVGGDVPDLMRDQSTYVVNSWTRTVARIAFGLGGDPVAILRGMGLKPDDGTRAILASELLKIKSGIACRGMVPDAPPDPAGFLAALLGPTDPGSSPALREARLSMQKAVEQYLVASGQAAPGMAGAADLADGRFCRSCMASLSDQHNQGASHQFCRWCSDEEGRLRPEDEVHQILTNWFMNWQKGTTKAQAAERARHYMLSMPAWAGTPATP